MNTHEQVEIGPIPLRAARVNLVTPPEGARITINAYTVYNSCDKPGSFSLWVGGSKAGKPGTELALNVVVAPRNRYECFGGFMLRPGEFLVGKARGDMKFFAYGHVDAIDLAKEETHALRVENNELKTTVRKLRAAMRKLRKKS